MLLWKGVLEANVSNPRLKRTGSGRNDYLLERVVQTHPYTFSCSPNGVLHKKSENCLIQDHSYCSSLGKTKLVSRSSTIVVCKTTFSIEGGPMCQFMGKRLHEVLCCSNYIYTLGLLTGLLLSRENILNSQSNTPLEQM